MSSPKSWRTSDGEQQPIKERPNIYEYENYYDLIIEMPSVASLMSAEEFYEFQANYNDSKK